MMYDNDDEGPSMGEEMLFDMMCAEAGWEFVEEDLTWITSTGKMFIADMTDSHLGNAIRWLGRTLAKADASGWEGAPNGMDVLIGRELEEMMHKKTLLEEEQSRRITTTRKESVLGEG